MTTKEAGNEPTTSVNVISSSWRVRQLMSEVESFVHPSVVDNNFMEMYANIPEVFWAIDYVAKRISEAHYDIKRIKDDSLVWCNRNGADRILKQPNALMTWREVVYQHFVHKLATGNAFFRAAMSEAISADNARFLWCENYWELPANHVHVVPKQNTYGLPLFGISSKEDLIDGYRLDVGMQSGLLIPTNQIWHDRDGMPTLLDGYGFMRSQSRLLSVKKPIANLLAVYEARNVIYLKRGALGFIVAQKEDPTGTVALDPKEKKALTDTVNASYGLGEGKSPYGITDVPISFVRTNLSISDLQPFEETLEDAIKIASVFGIPAVLVPRKDQSTFSNQETAEKSVYTGTIIPMAKRFCEELSQFLGLHSKGLYIDCDFSDVACLQTGLKEAEEVKRLVNDRCKSQFNDGLISINDWRAQIHESALEGEIFAKTRFDMTSEELAFIASKISGASSMTLDTSNTINPEENG